MGAGFVSRWAWGRAAATGALAMTEPGGPDRKGLASRRVADAVQVSAQILFRRRKIWRSWRYGNTTYAGFVALLCACQANPLGRQRLHDRHR